MYASVKHRHVTYPATIIAAAVALDTELISWAISIPPSWEPTPVTAPLKNQKDQGFGIYGDYYYAYTDLQISNIWNDYRATRYTLHEMIVNQLSMQHGGNGNQVPSEYSKLGAKSEVIMKEIAEDICASVPYHIGVAGSHSPGHGLNSSDSGHPAAAGYILTWHLFLAANCKFVPPSLRTWAIICMEKIGHSMGINQALSMACVLGRGRGPPFRDDKMAVMDVGTEVDGLPNVAH